MLWQAAQFVADVLVFRFGGTVQAQYNFVQIGHFGQFIDDVAHGWALKF